MRVVSKKELSLRDKKLYHFEKDTGFEVIKSETEGMYRVKWPDGVLSADHYNLTRAKEHAVTSYLELSRNPLSEPAGEFNGEGS